MADRPDYLTCDPCLLLAPALEIAIAAGRTILEIYEAGFAVEVKHDLTPCTEADLAAHRLIEQGLSTLTPSVPVLTEESAEIPFSERGRWRRYWLVDPLDGTREFIDRTGEFTVNIALIQDHQPVLGIIYAPVLGVYYYACKGEGAFKREATNTPVAIRARPWHGGKVTVACSRTTERGGHLNTYLQALGAHELVIMGGALKSCLVAEGKVDLYPRLGPTSEWDTAAAQCIVEEAGGHLTDTAMQVLQYNRKATLLNPHFFVFGKGDQDWSEFL
ncbi:MAG: 3'(2'),5'-bisphosphate nucleotidase CysQ [Gammaproteobacteria bacterium]|nr:3'(2'),5'-bisphosphate nucleotidase CysQ [Gammaproteobacteria bacterium]